MPCNAQLTSSDNDQKMCYPSSRFKLLLIIPAGQEDRKLYAYWPSATNNLNNLQKAYGNLLFANSRWCPNCGSFSR